MNAVIVPLAFLFVLLSIGGIFFVGVVYPIWTLIHCATSLKRTGGSKAIWIILIILIGPFGAILYGLFSGRKLFRWISNVCIILGILLGTTIFFTARWVYRSLKVEITNTISKMDQVDAKEITPQEVSGLKKDLAQLRDELSPNPIAIRSQAATNLMQLFQILNKDGRITRSEYEEWVDKFKSRHILDQKAFKKHIRDLQKK